MEWSNVAYETQAIYFSHRYILNSQGWIILQISFMENKIGERNPNNLKSGTTTLYFLEESKYYTIKQICEDSLHIPHFLAKQQMQPNDRKIQVPTSSALQLKSFSNMATGVSQELLIPALRMLHALKLYLLFKANLGVWFFVFRVGDPCMVPSTHNGRHYL